MNPRTIRGRRRVKGDNESKDYQGKEKGFKGVMNQRTIRGGEGV